MKKIKKVKNKTMRNNRVTRKRSGEKHAPAFLAIILGGVLLLEGLLFGIATSRDWQEGVKLLDISAAVSETIGDTRAVFEPQIKMVSDFNRFFQLAALEMTK